MTRTILALGSLLPAEMDELEAHFKVIRLWKEKDPEAALHQYSKEIVGIVSTWDSPVSARLIEALPNLEIISQFAVGVNNIDLVTAARRQVAVTNTPDVLTADTADMALALMLAVMRRVVEGDIYIRVGKWLNGEMKFGVSLAGKTVGIVGLGRIGRAIAKRCEAFDMDVVYYGPRRRDNVPYDYYDDLAAMAAACDVLMLSCAATPETEKLVNQDVLKALGPKGFLVNVARGAVVDEDDLLIALRNGTIAGAGLDVFADEPHVPEALFSMDNVVLSPHAGSATHEARSAMGRLVIENLLAHFRGEPLKTPVAA